MPTKAASPRARGGRPQASGIKRILLLCGRDRMHRGQRCEADRYKEGIAVTSRSCRFGIAENVTHCRIYGLRPALSTGISIRLVKNAQMQGALVQMEVRKM